MKILAAALAVLFAWPAYGQQCLPRDAFVAIAARDYGEARTFVGLVADQSGFVEMYANADTGSWTLIVSTPDGQSCIVATGEYYDMTNDPLPPAGEVN